MKLFAHGIANVKATIGSDLVANGMRTGLFRLTTIVLIAGILVGCRTVGPNYSRPIIEPPDAFRGAQTFSTDTTSLADLKWFEVFKDEALQDLIRTALLQNHDLRDAVVRIDAARANLGITRADQVPTIGLSSDVATVRTSGNGSFPALEGSQQRRTYGSIALNLLSFEIDVWGRLKRATEASRADLLAAQENQKAVVTTLVSDVASAYFNLLALDTELEIARRTLATRQESLKLIQNREKHGLTTLMEMRQGEQLVYAAERTIPEIEQLIEQTENQISLLLGQNPRSILRGRSLTAQEQPPTVPPGLPSALLERRPDIRAAEEGTDCCKRPHRRRKGRLLSANQLDRLAGFTDRGIARPLYQVRRECGSSYPKSRSPFLQAAELVRMNNWRLLGRSLR